MQMTKDAFYFSHDSNASHDPKILQMRSVYKAEGYGWYWMLIEQMREQKDYKLPISGKYALESYASQMDTTKKQLIQYLDDCVNEFRLFNRDAEFLWSDSLLYRMKLRENKSNISRKAVLKRWGKTDTHPDTDVSNLDTHPDTDVSKTNTSKNKVSVHPYPKPIPNKEKEIKRKQKESKHNKKETNYTDIKFTQFWDEYPRKSGKGAAETSFKKLNPSDELLEDILKAIKEQKESIQWHENEGQYIPMPSTWLNQKRWGDELAKVKNNGHKKGESIPRSHPHDEYTSQDSVDLGLPL